MSSIGIFVGSATGVTMEVGRQIHAALGKDQSDFYDLEDDYMRFDEILAYDTLIFGCSTTEKADLIDKNGKKCVAYALAVTMERPKGPHAIDGD